MNWRYICIAAAVMLAYLLFSSWRLRVAIARRCRRDIKEVLEQGKVKGRFE